MTQRDSLEARRIALSLFHTILTKKIDLDSASANHQDFKHLEDQRDRNFIRNLLATTFRRLGQIDDAIKSVLTKPNAKIDPAVQDILRVGACQILFLDVPDYAAVNTSIDLIKVYKMDHAKGFVNGVLRNIARQKDDLLKPENKISLNFPNWLYQSLQNDYGRKQAEAICKALLQEPRVDLTLKSMDMLQHYKKTFSAQHFCGQSLRLTSFGRIEALNGYDQGDWWVQGAGAHLAVHLLGDLFGKTAYDLCAAPGGKTLQLAASGAIVTAIDKSARRLKRLQQNLDRTRLKVETKAIDILKFTPSRQADIVLLDPPCSATGTLRKHPEGLHIKDASILAQFVSLQMQMLEHASTLLKPGGILLYCTCSLQKAEGEDQIKAFLENHTKFRIDPIHEDEADGLNAFCLDNGFMRILPQAHEKYGGMEGFFIARIKKIH